MLLDSLLIRCNRATWLLCSCIVVLPLMAQGPASFDVSSVKLHDHQETDIVVPACENNRFISHGMPMSEIFRWAYDLRSDQFLALSASLPAWAMELYNIDAVAGKAVPVSQCKLMVQQLLVTRFKMTAHWKKITNSPSYELRVAPKGPKLKAVTPADTGCGVHISYRGQERPCDRYQMPFAPKRAITMTDLARVLSIYTSSRPVIDLTGLVGEYKLTLSFALRSDDPEYPSLQTALKEQLGLELRDSKGDVDIMIVDRFERPTAN
ncbi:MAG: TIGR03435 family protein [Acidobacteriota bacterium]